MLMTQEELTDLRDHISLARSKAINFGICFGRSSAKNLIMNVDRQKNPMLLERYAKLDGESPRSMRGTFRISGNRFVMDLQGKVPQGGAWQLHQFFRKLGYPYKIELIEPGATAKPKKSKERRSKTDPQTAAPPVEAEAPPAEEMEDLIDEDDEEDTGVDPLQARWDQLRPRLDSAVTEFESSGAAKAGAVRKAWTAAIGVAERGDPASALFAARRIKAAIFEDEPPEPAPDPDAEKWLKLAPALQEQIGRVSSDNDTGGRLQQAWAEAVKRADAGDYKSALTIARKLVKVIARER